MSELVPEQWFESPPFSMPQAEKEIRLLNTLKELHQYHQAHCVEYNNLFSQTELSDIESLPYLAVRLFKHLSLSSIAEADVFKTLYSSGTTGQMPAKVLLDQETSRRQSKVLVKVLQDFIGKQRMPMLIIDHPGVVKSRNSYSARGAGIQGLSLFGRKPVFALNDDMSLNLEVVQNFNNEHKNTPVLLFGFTFMVWKYFIRALNAQNITLNLSQGTLLHSGGWKKLEAEKVSNSTFKETCKDVLGLSQVHNFYGMAEQVGSIFVECEQGHLHAPVYADVIIRDPVSMAVLPNNVEGVIQVLSIVPSSYPGNSLLTEDLGMILGVDDCSCGRKGKYFLVHGRLPKMEVRGCSDTAK
ncbi:acyl-protein synthetase [Planctobacterium marinum]|uniref:Acyl-protein synthetase n=1 Tax=Planctobacterium marinum TaxID=1631968 RepID=A0AA48KQH6_9ALTE|nr:acyl-protein synthetase [Planctobacterium marinum]